MKVLCWFLVGPAISVLIGCASAGRSVGREPSGGRLEGIWEVCLRVRTAPPESRHSPSVAGFISLTPMTDGAHRWMVLGEPTHYGVYTVALERLGIGGDPRIPVPLAGARTAGDSVYVAFDPFGSHGAVVLRGRLGPDTAAGIWLHQAYAMGAEGTFTMRRLPENTLPVPYPIGGPLVSPTIAGCPARSEPE